MVYSVGTASSVREERLEFSGKWLNWKNIAVRCVGAWVLVCSNLAAAEEYAYDPAADAAATYQLAIQQAAELHKLVLLVFGSEWCPDCRSLNEKMAQSPFSDTLSAHFVVAHVDIGNWDRNMAFTKQFGEPVAKGMPSIAIVSPDNRLLFVSEAGEFATARHLGLSALDSWFHDLLDRIGRD